MSFMRKILDSIKPHFTEGKLKKMYPAYDAFETFLFVPNHTSSTSCHVRDSVDLKRTMGTVILALVPCLLFQLFQTFSLNLEIEWCIKLYKRYLR